VLKKKKIYKSATILTNKIKESVKTESVNNNSAEVEAAM
jgi:hypothetical protein